MHSRHRLTGKSAFPLISAGAADRFNGSLSKSNGALVLLTGVLANGPSQPTSSSNNHEQQTPSTHLCVTRGAASAAPRFSYGSPFGHHLLLPLTTSINPGHSRMTGAVPCGVQIVCSVASGE